MAYDFDTEKLYKVTTSYRGGWPDERVEFFSDSDREKINDRVDSAGWNITVKVEEFVKTREQFFYGQ